MDETGWWFAGADLDGLHFVSFTLFGNNAPKSPKFVVENISNEGRVRG
jgi:hypothetical protein